MRYPFSWSDIQALSLIRSCDCIATQCFDSCQKASLPLAPMDKYPIIVDFGVIIRAIIKTKTLLKSVDCTGSGSVILFKIGLLEVY